MGKRRRRRRIRWAVWNEGKRGWRAAVKYRKGRVVRGGDEKEAVETHSGIKRARASDRHAERSISSSPGEQERAHRLSQRRFAFLASHLRQALATFQCTLVSSGESQRCCAATICPPVGERCTLSPKFLEMQCRVVVRHASALTPIRIWLVACLSESEAAVNPRLDRTLALPRDNTPSTIPPFAPRLLAHFSPRLSVQFNTQNHPRDCIDRLALVPFLRRLSPNLRSAISFLYPFPPLLDPASFALSQSLLLRFPVRYPDVIMPARS